jgi:ABC-type lipoprotein export system ATPase subunit
VTKVYGRGQATMQALRGIAPGELVALVGPSGSGPARTST